MITVKCEFKKLREQVVSHKKKLRGGLKGEGQRGIFRGTLKQYYLTNLNHRLIYPRLLKKEEERE